MAEQQRQERFLGRCRPALTPGGVLAVNLWNRTQGESRAARDAVTKVFADRFLMLRVAGGNSIAFGFARPIPRLVRRLFLRQAQTLGPQLGSPLHRLARDLWFENTHRLGPKGVANPDRL